ncbi:MAG: AMP-binding protein [Spirochaetales bacterium]|nr:AMP-binding protein [Spirochaetales bacterium]
MKKSIDKNQSKIAFLSKENNLTYSKFWNDSLEFAAFLIKKGVKKGDHVAFVAENSVNKSISELGVLCSGGVVVPLMPNISESDFDTICFSERISFIILEDFKLVEKLVKHSKVFNMIKYVIVLSSSGDDSEKSNYIKTFDSVMELGNKFLAKNPNLSYLRINDIQGDNPAFVFFTSIFQNKPKGVILSHRAICAGVKQVLHSFGMKANKKIVFALPSSIAFSTTLLYAAYSRSLKIKFSGLPAKKLGADFRQYKPDIFAAMPELWEKIFSDYMKKIDNQGLIKTKFFELITRGSEIFYFFVDVFNHPLKFSNRFYVFMLRLGLVLPMFVFSIPYIVFNFFITPEVKKIFGGNLSIGITGNRHIYRTTVGFFRSAGIMLVKSYGHPEACGLIATTGKRNMFGSSDGKIIENINYKIINKLGESLSDTKKGRLFIQSPSLFSGYTTGIEDTSKVLYENWYDTGDIVRFMSNGLLVIVKRASELLKLNNGLEVDKEYIEYSLAANHYIDKAVLTLDNLENKLDIVVFPDLDFLVSYARKNNIQYFDFDELLRKQMIILFYRNKVKKFIKEEINLLDFNDVGRITLKKE